MTQLPESRDNKIKSNQDCSYSLSLSIGAGLAFFLGMLPLVSIACINLVIAGFVTVYHFTKVNEVSLTAFMGTKIAFYATFLGSLLLVFAQDMLFYRSYGTNLAQFKAEAAEAFQEVWGDRMVEFMNTNVPDQLTQGMIVSVILSQIFVFAIASIIASLIGGSFAASKYKRGKLLK